MSAVRLAISMFFVLAATACDLPANGGGGSYTGDEANATASPSTETSTSSTSSDPNGANADSSKTAKNTDLGAVPNGPQASDEGSNGNDNNEGSDKKPDEESATTHALVATTDAGVPPGR